MIAETPQVECAFDTDGRWQITLRGEIDLIAQPLLDDTARKITGADPAGILVDLTGVSFLASNGLGFLAQLSNHATPTGHTVTLHGPDRAIRRTIELLGFDTAFCITG
jgi:anti-sigma B factor antagonist